jgi:hypothetical protein
MAAICYDHDTKQSRIAFGFDSHAEVAWAGGNVAFKFAWATKKWPALIAGDTSKAEDLLSTCREVFEEDDEELNRNNIFDKFNNVSCVYKEKLCRRYVRQQLGIDYERFLTQGEDELPPELRGRIFHELARLDYECELLIFGFTRRVNAAGEDISIPHIVEIDRYGEVSLHQNFGAIGTGSVIAKSTLYQREQMSFLPIEETLYHLYEAARLASQSAPSVGEIHQLQILDQLLDEESSIRLTSTNYDCFRVLADVFQEVGQKPLIPIDKFSAEHFKTIIPFNEEEETQQSDSETSEGQQ